MFVRNQNHYRYLTQIQIIFSVLIERFRIIYLDAKVRNLDYTFNDYRFYIQTIIYLSTYNCYITIKFEKKNNFFSFDVILLLSLSIFHEGFMMIMSKFFYIGIAYS